MVMAGFRPLIRGFFFYISNDTIEIIWYDEEVSVPSFGDSFFIVFSVIEILNFVSFRPLIRGFFFYHFKRRNIMECM